MNTEQPKRTPQQIIGADALTQLIFEGYEVMPARRSSDEQAEVVAWQWQQCKSLQPGVWPEQWNNIELRPGEDRTQYWRDLAARIPDEVRVRPLYASPPAVAAGGVTEALLRLVHQPNPTDPTRWDVGLVRYGVVAHDDGSDRMEPVARGQWVRADEAAATIERLVAENRALIEALTPFAAEKLPSSKATEIAYNEFGLRCLMSPLAIARQRARQALKDAP